MKFECTTLAYYQCLQNSTKAIPIKTNDMFSGVLIIAEQNQITMQSTDGSFSIKCSIAANVYKEGRVMVPGKLMTEIARKLPSGTVTFTMNDNYACHIDCMQFKSTIMGYYVDDYPIMEDIIQNHAFHFPQKQIKDMLNKVNFVIPARDAHHYLTGCFMEISKNELRFVGLDGYRMALQIYKDDIIMPSNKEMVSAIIPGHVIREVIQLLSDDNNANNTVTFHLTEKHVMIIIDNTTVLSSLLVGKFMDYRRILPSQWATQVKLKKEEIRDSFERASLIAKESKQNVVKISYDYNNIIVSAKSEFGDVSEQLDGEFKGEKLDIAFNARYILELLRYVDNEEILFSMNSSTNPCIITSADDDSFVFMVLPVRLREE